MQSIRNIAAIAIFFPCLILTFQGFPFAFMSYLGFIGTLSAVTVLICAIFHPMNSPKSVRVGVLFFGVLILIGSISLILMQATIHIGVNIRLFPTTGMTLPFLSYGGSSIISTSILAGIILNLTKRKIS